MLENNFWSRLQIAIKKRQEKVKKDNLKDMSRKEIISALILHALIIAIFFTITCITPYSNYKGIFGCVHATFSLIVVAYLLKDRIKNSFSKSITYILYATIAGIILSVILMNTPIIKNVQKSLFNTYFENNKDLIGENNYSIYSKNKNNLEELVVLRKNIHKELDL